MRTLLQTFHLYAVVTGDLATVLGGPANKVCVSEGTAKPLDHRYATFADYEPLPAVVLQLRLHADRANRSARTKTKQVHQLNNVSCRMQAARYDAAPVVSAPASESAQNKVVLDRLIAVFSAKSPTEWRKLIAHSKQWPQLAEGVLSRCSIPWSR